MTMDAAQPHRIILRARRTVILRLHGAALTPVYANTRPVGKTKILSCRLIYLARNFQWPLDQCYIQLSRGYRVFCGIISFFACGIGGNDGSVEAKNFLSELNDPSTFEDLKRNPKIRELPERIKTPCRLPQFPEPHLRNPPPLGAAFF